MIDLALDGDGQIDTGVTSGADPSEWDPIAVDIEGRVNACAGGDGGQRAGDPTAPAVCETTHR